MAPRAVRQQPYPAAGVARAPRPPSTVATPEDPGAVLGAAPPPHRFPSLHGYRALAAVSVVVFHVAGYAGLTLGNATTALLLDNLADFGLATFFVLSGLLLHLPFVSGHLAGAAPPDPVLALRRRVVRIWPAYIIAVGAFLALGLSTARNAGPDHWFSVLSLTHIYRRGYGSAGIPIAWTLAVQVAFYVALPFLAAGIRGLTRLAAGPEGRTGLSVRQRMQGELVGIATLAGIALIYRALVAGPAYADPETYPFAVFHLWLFNYLDWFALGMALAVAVAWRDSGRPLPRKLVSLAERGWACWALAAGGYALAVVILGSMAVSGAPGEIVRDTTAQLFVRFEGNGAVAVLFLLPAVLGTGFDPLNRVLARAVPVYLGTISYGIYLWHKVWIDKVRDLQAARLGFWVMLGIISVLTLVTASLSYHLVERPLYRFKAPRRRRGAEGS